LGILLAALGGVILAINIDERGNSQISENFNDDAAPTPTPSTAPTATNTNSNNDEPPKNEVTPANPPEEFEIKPEIVWGNQTKKQVIFTFDGGAGTHSADLILQTLKNNNIKATFFLTGRWAELNPALVKRIANEGHEIFNHTYSHPDLTTISDAQISEEFRKSENIIRNLTGKSTKPFFRPPFGARNIHVRELAAKEGYQSIYWTVDAFDWKEEGGFTDAQTKERIFSNLKPGTIFMMHIGDNITGRILDDVIRQIKSRGYEIVPLSKGI